jgi:hypothetical protein
MIKARKVMDIEPERFKKRPNLGTKAENAQVIRTTMVLKIMLLI